MDLGWLSNIDIGALMALPLLGLTQDWRGTRVGGKSVGGVMSKSAISKVDSLRAGMGGAGVDPKDKARAQQQLRDIVQNADKQRMKANESKPAKTPRAPKPATSSAAERDMTARQRRELDQSAGAIPSPVRRPARTTRGGATVASAPPAARRATAKPAATTPTASAAPSTPKTRGKRASQGLSTRRDARGLSSREQQRLDAAQRQLKSMPRGGSAENQRRREMLSKTVNQLKRKAKAPIGTQFPYSKG